MWPEPSGAFRSLTLTDPALSIAPSTERTADGAIRSRDFMASLRAARNRPSVSLTSPVCPKSQYAGLETLPTSTPGDACPPDVLRRAHPGGLWRPCAAQLTLNTRYSTPPANRRPSARKRLVASQL